MKRSARERRDIRERMFTCAGCKQRVSWSKGCDDDMPDHCDDCWEAAHNAKDGAK